MPELRSMGHKAPVGEVLGARLYVVTFSVEAAGRTPEEAIDGATDTFLSVGPRSVEVELAGT